MLQADGENKRIKKQMPIFSSVGGIAKLLVALSLLLSVHSCTEQQLETTSMRPAPKMILIIGDGMDDQQITIARNYLSGNNGRLKLDELPYRGVVQVQAVDEANPGQAVYVTDSASTATAIATGRITSSRRIATSAGTDERLLSIMEIAQSAGLGTGIVTTASLTDATPAAFATHINNRFCQGPADMVSIIGATRTPVNCSQYIQANGGGGSISEQIAALEIDILLGGGTQYFDQISEANSAMSVMDAAVANGYKVIRKREELALIEADTKVLGLFSPSTMPVRLRGVGGAQAEKIERINGQVRLPAAYSCEPNPQFAGMPTLAEMTRAALSQFDDVRGFMLMVESASIDKQSHRRRPCGSIGELAQLNEALEVALEYAVSHPETLILVTADHSQAAQLISDKVNLLAPNNASPGFFARLLTPEGSVMGINYATTDWPRQEGHTGAQVPLYAFGPNVNQLPSFIRQAEIFGIMERHLGLGSH